MFSYRTITKSILILVGCCCLNGTPPDEQWLIRKSERYTIYYTAADQKQLEAYDKLIKQGLGQVTEFFGLKFLKTFDIYIHPHRASLDSAWSISWNMPGFKSECWMVASGVANRFDLVSPMVWTTDACEHQYSDSLKTQRLITHELVHVFHGQHNASPDFSATEGIDWFVEGLATFASGQCDSARMADVRKALSENKVPTELDKFWTGKLRYGLSGSMAWYLDVHFGRKKIIELLPFTKKAELLASLNITEEKLLADWKTFVMAK